MPAFGVSGFPDFDELLPARPTLRAHDEAGSRAAPIRVRGGLAFAPIGFRSAKIPFEKIGRSAEAHTVWRGHLCPDRVLS